MTTRAQMPGHLRAALLVYAAAGLALVVWELPHWLTLVHIGVGGAVLALLGREVMRNRPVVRSAKLLWLVAAAILLVAVMTLAAGALS